MYYINYYKHCNSEWTDIHDCKCNDHCPDCDAEIEPYKSEEMEE